MPEMFLLGLKVYPLCSIFPRPYYALHYAGIIRPSLFSSHCCTGIYNYAHTAHHSYTIQYCAFWKLQWHKSSMRESPDPFPIFEGGVKQRQTKYKNYRTFGGAGTRMRVCKFVHIFVSALSRNYNSPAFYHEYDLFPLLPFQIKLNIL